MTSHQPPRAARHRTGPALVAVLVAVAVVLGSRLPAWPAAPLTTRSLLTHASPHRFHEHPPDGRHGTLGLADGKVPDGTTVFDGGVPAVARLDPALLAALRRAATDARGDGIELFVNSGWRSRAYQAQLLDSAISEYGSRAEAARWVATPATSPHVSGEAVDLGPSDATTWLAEHGAGYGLCRIYGNEPWHFELRPGAVGHGCPRTYDDPTDDPRMRR